MSYGDVFLMGYLLWSSEELLSTLSSKGEVVSFCCSAVKPLVLGFKVRHWWLGFVFGFRPTISFGFFKQ